MNNKETIHNVAEHAEQLQMNLDADKPLTVEECETALLDLTKLQRLSDEAAEQFSEMSIEELFLDFTHYAESSKQHLQSALNMITDGKIPSEENVLALDLSLGNLRQKYHNIYQSALSLLPPDEMPNENASVQEYVEAVQNSKTLNLKKQLLEATDCLRKFISVRSLVKVYADALAPYQSQAVQLLHSINADSVITGDELVAGIAGPSAFLAALECPDKDSEEGIDLCDSVDQYYPKRVSTGIVADKYFVDKDALNDLLSEDIVQSELHEQESSSEDTQSPAENTQIEQSSFVVDALHETNEVEEHTTNVETHEDSDEAGTNSLVTDELNIPETEHADPESPESGFAKALKQNDCYIRPDQFGKIQISSSPNENRKISASIFINELKGGNTTAEKKIIQFLSSLNCVTSEEAICSFNMPEDIAQVNMDYLYRKGYLRKCTITPGGSFFCSSPRLKKALSSLDASKFAGVKQRSIHNWPSIDEESVPNISTRVGFCLSHAASVSIVTGSLEDRIEEDSEIFYDAFINKRYNTNNPAQCILFFGAFWETNIDCDRVLERLRRLLSISPCISAAIITAVDAEQAKRITFELLKELEGDVISVPIFLHSLSENTYCTYPDMSPVALLSIREMIENTATDVDVDIESIETAKNNDHSTDTVSHVDTQDTHVTENTTSAPDAEQSVAEQKTTATETTQPVEESEQAVSDIESIALVPNKEQKSAFAITSFDDIKKNIYQMICSRRFYAATAYAKSMSAEKEDAKLLYNQLAYALNDPMEHCSYSSANGFNLISNRDKFEDCLIISAALRMFFSNQIKYDYSLKSFYSGIKDYPILSRYPTLSKALYTLVEFKASQKKGIDAYADYRAKSRTQLDREISVLKKEACDFYENFITGQKKERCSQKRFLETKTLMFSENGYFGMYIKAIIDGQYDLADMVAEFLQENFYETDAVIAEDTFDNDYLWNYIQQFWDEAGRRMKLNKRSEDLKSRLRSNITSETTKAVQLLAKWYNLVLQLNAQSDDAGAIEYKRVKKPLMDNLNSALNDMTQTLGELPKDSEESAGITVLFNTVTDLFSCLDGSYNENCRKYFYLPFLLTPDIVLTEELLPDLDVHSSVLPAMLPSNRIIQHCNSMASSEISYLDRLSSILNEKGDDYGSAQQIADYLSVVSPETDLSDIMQQINEGEAFAKQSADIARTDFIGELELAQSYGQIVNSAEDKKEMILQVVDEWYEWADETANYGFFRSVMEAYLADIRESAKAREADLLAQLEKFRLEASPALSTQIRNDRIARIQDMIKEQNYTVAEDLLGRFLKIEDEYEEKAEEYFLEDFLKNYDDYYTPVAKVNASFSSLVSSRTRNKEQRGAKRLADNWLPGGSAIGKERLRNLLFCLGFKVKSVQPQGSIGKFENYFVETADSENGKRINYTHPISAFGSGAAQDGFRVVCVNGNYDANGLIDIMKKIGDAKHTLILFDYALSLSERRRLARKSKNALGDRLFAVVDRTVMMFLVRNYDENKVNRMLISLIVPFGYYQPYVWDSANVMPPELFMGRKNELEKIKSAKGVNIVYGGRQLGKSALLKKAKADIDGDENNDRAVYIEIKDKNYEEAARTVGHELYDQNILEQDIDTTDWEELARAIKRRLQSETAPKIPYLLLLLDEADAFIESSVSVNFKPFDKLKDIQSIGPGRFKFVVAGLRNVVRLKREVSLGHNSVLTHLQYMTVKPFSFSEARELLETPLHYLGLRFPKENESLVTLILATTNYFPGLIQLYCAKLLEAMRSKDYAGYNEVDTPIYEVSEGHIKKVLADPSFTQQIREKFEITLRLGGDNYYYLIALLMAYLYHNNGYNSGYSAADIKKTGTEYGISKIAALDESTLSAFMEELCELNVLRYTDKSHCLFTRVSFFQMMGTSAEVDDKLEEYMED